MRTRTQDSLKQFFNVTDLKYEYIRYARTMLIMYKCTKQKHYLVQARECVDKALKVDFICPLDMIVNEAA